jgi:hypothetical protein
MTTDPSAREIRVSVELDSEDLREHAERHAGHGEHGAAHVLFAAADHMEAGGDIPAWVGTVDDGEESSDEQITGPAAVPVIARTDPTAQPTPTPAPVAVPEGGWLTDDEWRDFQAIPDQGYSHRSWVNDRITERVTEAVHAPREAYGEPNDTTQHAPRPEPVTARDHHVPGAENFNALLDDVLANPEAREAFEAAQAEPVTAPLPSERERRALGTLLAGVVDGGVDSVADAILAAGYRRPSGDEPAPLPSEAVRDRLDEVIRKAQVTAYPDGKGGHLFRPSRPAEVADAVLAAGFTLPAADQPLPSEAVEALSDQVRLAVPAMMPGLAERIAEALTAAGCTLPAVAQRARDEGTAREEIAREIEAERVKVTAASGSNDRAWQLGHNKGLADAAHIARGGSR